MKRLVSILLGSVLVAAFLGPGTVTTAASAGSRHGTALLWALVFSTLACLVLQEAAGRLTITSGLDLGQAIRMRFGGSPTGAAVVPLVLGSIVLGCAAYEGGNILGGVAGVRLVIDRPASWLTAAVVGIAASVLALETTQGISRALGGAVGVMGVAFLVTAVRLEPDPLALASGSLLPHLPRGSSLLALALVGTTVVPYNLFLGSRIARGLSLAHLRLGLAVAILLGGLISMGVLVTGTAVPAPFTFEGLAEALRVRLGSWAPPCFALGLFAAGLSSAITAPLAAAIAARSLLGGSHDAPDRHGGEPSRTGRAGTWRDRAVWIAVLGAGAILGLAGVKPIPAILLAQALNGVLLPCVAVFLLIVVNDASLVGREGRNGALSNTAMALVVAVTIGLGTRNVLGAATEAIGGTPPRATLLGIVSAALLVGVSWPVAKLVREGRGSPPRGPARKGTRAGSPAPPRVRSG